MHQTVTATSLDIVSHAAQAAGISIDEALILSTAHTQLLTAVARGAIDLNAMAKAELAARGLNQNGQWVGFADAQAALTAQPEATIRAVNPV